MGLYNEKKSLTAGFVCLLLIAVVLFIRNSYSFSWSDESLYISMIHRLFLGGKPFVDEWHPTQFYAILFVPFYYIYVKLSGGGYEGIFLLARNFYLLLAFLTACYVFYIFKMKIKLGMPYCISAGGFVLLYSWANVMGISYHNIFFLSVMMAEMLLIRIVLDWDKMSSRKSRGYCIAVGIFAGCGVITIPTAAIFVGILFLAFFCLNFNRKLYNNKIKMVAGIIYGMVLDAIFYIGFVWSRVSTAELLEHIGYLFQDKDHEIKCLSDYFFKLALLLHGYGKYVLPLICIAVCLRFILFVKKKDGLWLRDILYYISAPVLLYSLYAYAGSHMGTYIILGLYSFFLIILFVERKWLKERELIVVVSILWTAGCIMIGAFLLASATSGPISTGFVSFSLIALIVFDRKIKESKDKKRMIAGIIAVGILFVMLGMTGMVRVRSVYRDAPLSELDTRLERGPGKGLITTAGHAEQYDACMDVIDYINEMEQSERAEATIIVSKLAPWIYTGLNIQNGAPTAWACEISDPNIERYYATHDIRQLKYVLVLREEYGGYIGAGNPEGTFLTPNQNDVLGWMGNILENEFVPKDFKCGTLYMRK